MFELKPKSKEEFLAELEANNTYININLEKQYKEFYKEDFPFDKLPMFMQINRFLSQNYPKYFKGNGSLDVRRTHMYYGAADFVWKATGKRVVSLNMSPTRRIPELESRRDGTRFILLDYKEIEIIIKFLETN